MFKLAMLTQTLSQEHRVDQEFVKCKATLPPRLNSILETLTPSTILVMLEIMPSMLPLFIPLDLM